MALLQALGAAEEIRAPLDEAAIGVDRAVETAAWPVLSARDRLIIRIEGAVLRDGHVAEGAAAALRAAAGRFVLVSDNSRDTGRTLAAKLRRYGLAVPAERIVLAGEETVRRVAARHPGASCLVAASRVLAHAVRGHGLVPVQREAEVIILGRDPGWTYQRLALIANEVARGAMVYAISPRAALRGNDGRIIPDTGALTASIEAATGRAVTEVVGRPGGAMVRAALARLEAIERAPIDIANVVYVGARGGGGGDEPWAESVGADMPPGLRMVRLVPPGSAGADSVPAWRAAIIG